MDIKDLQFETSKDEKDLTTLKAYQFQKRLTIKNCKKQIEYYKPKVNIKGFRIGHAPNDIVYSRYRTLYKELQMKFL